MQSNTTPCTVEQIQQLINQKSYSALASCVVKHIITNPKLTYIERLYYLTLDMGANYNLSTIYKRIIKQSAAITKNLLNTSDGTVYKIRKSLENKGYLIINRNNKKYDSNRLMPTLPEEVYNLLLSSETDKKEISTNRKNACYREILDNQKMFVPLNKLLIELLLQNNNLSGLQKCIWIYLYIHCYCSMQKNGQWITTTTQNELCSIFECKQSSISRALSALKKFGFISSDSYKIEANIDTTAKNILFVKALYPQEIMLLIQEKQNDRINAKPFMNDGIKRINKPISDTISTYAQTNYTICTNQLHDMHKPTIQYAQTDNINTRDKIKTLNIKNNNNNIDVFLEKNNSEEKLNEQFEIKPEKELARQISLPSLDINEIWELSCKELKNILSPKEFSMLIQPLQFKYLNDVLVIFVPNNYLYQDLIKNKNNINNIIINASENKINQITFSVGSLREFEASQERKLNPIKQVNEINLKNQPVHEKTKDIIPEIKNFEILIENLINNIQKPKEESASEKNNWNIDIREERLKNNLVKLTKPQVKQAINYAKKLKIDNLCAYKYRDMSFTEIALQLIHHAANFKMSKLNLINRDEEVSAALNFAYSAIKQGTWGEPTTWAQSKELHLSQQKLKYEHESHAAIKQFTKSLTACLS